MFEAEFRFVVFLNVVKTHMMVIMFTIDDIRFIVFYFITVTSKWLQWRLKYTGVSIVCSTVCSGADKNIKAPRHWTFWGESTGDRWILFTKGQ